ncbi:hypothetical protein HPMG_01300 [Helicobacter pullorum MIT 98-5489]|uniref:Uncharacterized protein n=1 Tax=Helicobacter pullorum MIT 98-5489 TaxID=537972 RepID=C5F0T9_9HELI|nr:hypothetical protein HPMG_01300 [Helicobacter pullorum MIT 98-5489]
MYMLLQNYQHNYLDSKPNNRLKIKISFLFETSKFIIKSIKSSEMRQIIGFNSYVINVLLRAK